MPAETTPDECAPGSGSRRPPAPPQKTPRLYSAPDPARVAAPPPPGRERGKALPEAGGPAPPPLRPPARAARAGVAVAGGAAPPPARAGYDRIAGPADPAADV